MRSYLAQLDVCFCSIVQRVTREVGRRLHLKLRAPVALVTKQEVRAAADIETQPLSALSRTGCGVRLNLSVTGWLGISGSVTSVSIAISGAVLRLVSSFLERGR